jgi:hypothetical protein
MALKFKCSDVGFDCGFVAKGKTEDEILAVRYPRDPGSQDEAGRDY